MAEDSTSEHQWGVIYVACGAQYRMRAIYSALSLRRHMPKVPICLFTNDIEASDVFGYQIHVDHDPNFRFSSKARALALSPFKRTVFLDADTVVLNDLSCLFRSLEYFDFGAPLNLHRIGVPGFESCGEAVIQFNASTLAYRTTPA